MSNSSTDSTSARVALPRELAGLLIELAIALQNFGVYPAGHPFLSRSAEGVMRRLVPLLSERSQLAFGVARDQLVIEGVATDPANPVLAGLAGRLHRHRVGAVTLSRGLAEEEALELLRVLAADPDASPAGEGGPALPHVRLHPLSYASLELSGDGDGTAGEDDPRAARLWVGLARAAVANEEDDGADIGAVAEAINRQAGAAAYDQVIVGYMLQLAGELRSGGGAGAAEVRRRLSRTLDGLSAEALKRLLEMGGDSLQRRRFLVDASHGFAADAVVRLIEAGASTGGESISQSMLRVLNKLAAHARGSSRTATAAESELRSQVQSLVAGWSLTDPNPTAYTATLARFSGLGASPGGGAPATHGAEAERVVQMALEVGVKGAAASAALRSMVRDGRATDAIALLEAAPAHSPALEGMWEVVATPDTLISLLSLGPDAAHALDRLVARLGELAIPPLLEQLQSESRTVRRAALALLERLGPPAAEAAVQRLDDTRWYIQRNLLMIIAAAGPPAGFSPAAHLKHDDPRVRREAFRVAVGIPEERPRAIGLALGDPDGQMQLAGLAECGRGVPAAALPLICRRAADPATDAELRVMAIRALATSRDSSVLRTLLFLVDGGRTLFGRQRLAPTSPEMLAALAVLSAAWGDHPEAQPPLKLARRSSDAAVLRAVILMTAEP